VLPGARPLDPHEVHLMMEVALGKSPADTIIRGARLIHVLN
jgi:hypothetical protein